MSLKRICVRIEKLKCPKIPHCPKIPVMTLEKKEDFFEGVADRSILLTLMKQEVKEKMAEDLCQFPQI